MRIVTSPRFEEHTTPPGHPERPERAQVFDAVAAVWRERGATTAAPRPATREELRRVHSAAHIEDMVRTAGRAVALDPDTFTSPESYEIALLAAGAAVQAAEHALDSRRAGRRARAAARAPRRARPGDGLLPVQQRRGRRRARASRAGCRASRSSTSTSTTATARRRSSTTIRACCTSRRTSSRSIRAPARPTRSGTGAGDGFTVNVPLDGRRDRRRLRARLRARSCARARASSRRSCCSSRPASTRTTTIRWRRCA